MTRQLNNTLPDLLPKETIEHAAKQLGICVKGTVVLDHVDQTAIKPPTPTPRPHAPAESKLSTVPV